MVVPMKLELWNSPVRKTICFLIAKQHLQQRQLPPLSWPLSGPHKNILQTFFVFLQFSIPPKTLSHFSSGSLNAGSEVLTWQGGNTSVLCLSQSASTHIYKLLVPPLLSTSISSRVQEMNSMPLYFPSHELSQ